ncbi:hypothetical protein ARTHRO9V_280002 [Arthrobacter sp. 9V]|nr:hypothetical protein ARTHRO9V_280002 [Arthrobacter sp. 9V]
MNWDMQDGIHEGWPGAVAPDGRITGDIRTGSPSVQGISGSFPRHPVHADQEIISDDRVVGWRSLCACGWFGPFWKRVPTSSEASLSKRRAFVPLLGVAVPSVIVEDTMRLEWTAHAIPASAISELQAAFRVLKIAEARVSRGVQSARSAGVSWARIGHALEVSRQSAHERWKS